MRDAAADRAAIPDLRIADLRRRLRDHRALVAQQLRRRDLGVRRRGADLDAAAGFLDPRQAGNPRRCRPAARARSGAASSAARGCARRRSACRRSTRRASRSHRRSRSRVRSRKQPESCAASLTADDAIDDPPQLLGPQHHVDVFHAERAQRVDRRRHDARRRSERAGFADALRAERIARRRRHGRRQLEAREIGGPRHRVVHERSGHQLAVVVVDRFFDHRLADALRQAAVDLSFDDQRVDQIAGIVDGDQLQQLRLAGLAIDLEHRDVAAERIGVVRRLEERFVAEARLDARRQRHGHIGVAGDRRERFRLGRRALDADHAVLEDDVVFAGFEHRRGELRHLLLHLAAGEMQRRAGDRLRAAAEGADALLHDAGVAVQDRDVLDRHAELIGQHLRERRLVALAVRRRAGRRGNAAVALDRDLAVFPSAGRQRR